MPFRPETELFSLVRGLLGDEEVTGLLGILEEEAATPSLPTNLLLL